MLKGFLHYYVSKHKKLLHFKVPELGQILHVDMTGFLQSSLILYTV